MCSLQNPLPFDLSNLVLTFTRLLDVKLLDATTNYAIIIIITAALTAETTIKPKHASLPHHIHPTITELPFHVSSPFHQPFYFIKFPSTALTHSYSYIYREINQPYVWRCNLRWLHSPAEWHRPSLFSWSLAQRFRLLARLYPREPQLLQPVSSCPQTQNVLSTWNC